MQLTHTTGDGFHLTGVKVIILGVSDILDGWHLDTHGITSVCHNNFTFLQYDVEFLINSKSNQRMCTFQVEKIFELAGIAEHGSLEISLLNDLPTSATIGCLLDKCDCHLSASNGPKNPTRQESCQ